MQLEKEYVNMFDLTFGLFWLIFTLFFFFMWNFFPSNEGPGAVIIPNIIIIGFIAIGVWLTYKGIKKVVANKKTDMYGELCKKRNGTLPRWFLYAKNRSHTER